MKSLPFAIFILLISIASVANAQFKGSGGGNYTLEAVCGNTVCETNETNSNCPQDCTIVTCGNPPTCDSGETCSNCPSDCNICVLPTCGNNICDVDKGEDCNNCLEDCNAICPSSCGDGACTWGETNTNCPSDCPLTCGNNICDSSEDCSNCASDCGGCPVCGNKACDAGETTLNCPSDCSSTPIEIDIEYEYVKKGIVPLIPAGSGCTNPRGCPNYTKTMPVKFIARGTIKSLISEKCTDTKCDSFYSFESGPITAMQWDAFSQGFVGNIQTRTANCNQYHTLIVTMATNNSGGSATQKIYVNCEQRITLNPAERRLAVGEKNKLGFLLNVWNPTNLRTYNIEIRPSPDQDFVSSWLRFECGAAPACSVTNNVLTVTVEAVNNRGVQVMLTNESSSRSGTYPVNFVDSGNRIQGIGTLLVYAEGLSEFQAWQLIALILGAAAIFAVLK